MGHSAFSASTFVSIERAACSTSEVGDEHADASPASSTGIPTPASRQLDCALPAAAVRGLRTESGVCWVRSRILAALPCSLGHASFPMLRWVDHLHLLSCATRPRANLPSRSPSPHTASVSRSRPSPRVSGQDLAEQSEIVRMTRLDKFTMQMMAKNATRRRRV